MAREILTDSSDGCNFAKAIFAHLVNVGMPAQMIVTVTPRYLTDICFF